MLLAAVADVATTATATIDIAIVVVDVVVDDFVAAAPSCKICYIWPRFVRRELRSW